MKITELETHVYFTFDAIKLVLVVLEILAFRPQKRDKQVMRGGR